jgi:hypothetical protein
MQDPKELIEAFGRGLAQGLVGARAVTTLKAKQRKTRSKKVLPVASPVQEEMFPIPTFGREEEITPEQFAQMMSRAETSMGNPPPEHRRPSPPPPKEFPGDERFPKVNSDTYQPSREDDTDGQATGIPWRS